MITAAGMAEENRRTYVTDKGQEWTCHVGIESCFQQFYNGGKQL